MWPFKEKVVEPTKKEVKPYCRYSIEFVDGAKVVVVGQGWEVLEGNIFRIIDNRGCSPLVSQFGLIKTVQGSKIS